MRDYWFYPSKEQKLKKQKEDFKEKLIKLFKLLKFHNNCKISLQCLNHYCKDNKDNTKCIDIMSITKKECFNNIDDVNKKIKLFYSDKTKYTFYINQTIEGKTKTKKVEIYFDSFITRLMTYDKDTGFYIFHYSQIDYYEQVLVYELKVFTSDEWKEIEKQFDIKYFKCVLPDDDDDDDDDDDKDEPFFPDKDAEANKDADKDDKNINRIFHPTNAGIDYMKKTSEEMNQEQNEELNDEKNEEMNNAINSQGGRKRRRTIRRKRKTIRRKRKTIRRKRKTIRRRKR